MTTYPSRTTFPSQLSSLVGRSLLPESGKRWLKRNMAEAVTVEFQKTDDTTLRIILWAAPGIEIARACEVQMDPTKLSKFFDKAFFYR